MTVWMRSVNQSEEGIVSDETGKADAAEKGEQPDERVARTVYFTPGEPMFL